MEKGVIKINKKWVIYALVLLTILALVCARPAKEFYIKSRLEPQVEVDKALVHMVNVKNYKYSLNSTFKVDNREEVVSRVIGEKNGENTHIKGEMVNTAVDIYYIDHTIYNLDSFSHKWLVIPSNTKNSGELLISELNPLSNFRFKSIESVEKLGFEKIDKSECLVVSCRPDIESQLLETLWKDFEYRLWIDYKQNLLRKAVLTAANKQNGKTKLRIEVRFKDFDQKIHLTPPDLSSANKKK
ncbi:MAG TPA: hypothetical protein VHQ70_11475 [Syntrophomonadaceae bacterium]|nr:hypothetical protein [Syntrophomonadaceae bacterium]